MQGVEAGVRIKLSDKRKTDRGPVIKVRAILPVRDGVPSAGWYGLSTKENKTRVNGEEFECYLADFSDHDRKTVMCKSAMGGYQEISAPPGWMEFVNPDDRKRWEEWMAKGRKAQGK